MTHYIVGYHEVDTKKHQKEICEIATDSYEAIKDAIEDVPYLKEHPHFVDYCLKTEEEK